MYPALFILALLFAHACAAQPAPAQLEIHAIAPLPKPRKPCIDCIYTDRIRRTDSAAVAYIKRHADDALYVEYAHGLPAYILLAVGIHESRFGTSNIARNANNHFGFRYYAEAHQYIDSRPPYQCENGRMWRTFPTVRDSYIAVAEACSMAPYLPPYCWHLTPDKFAATGWGGRKSCEREAYARDLKKIISRYSLEKI
jgi:hypothetical protein